MLDQHTINIIKQASQKYRIWLHSEDCHQYFPEHPISYRLNFALRKGYGCIFVNGQNSGDMLLEDLARFLEMETFW
jgi:hypothetical protein